MLGIGTVAIAWLGVSLWVQRPTFAAEVNDGASCPLPIGEQVKAVKAFGEMLPVFRHPRCLNCHGGVDPLSTRHRGVDQLDPEITLMTDHVKFKEQCQMCHDGLPGWTIPGESLFFVGKDDEELCLQMKRSERTAEGFVSHIHDDHQSIQFIAAGFAGDRALGEQGLKDYGLVVEKPPGTQAELTAKAKKWVAAMGGKYVGSPECGCVMPKIKLKVQHQSTYNTSHPRFRAGWVGFDGDVDFEVALLPVGPEGWYRGETTVVRSMKVQFAARGCSGTASQTEHWRFNARVDRTSQMMQLQFGFITSDESGSAQCPHGAGPQINPQLFHDLDQIVVPLERGATKEETLQEPNGVAQERLVVNVKATPAN